MCLSIALCGPWDKNTFSSKQALSIFITQRKDSVYQHLSFYLKLFFHEVAAAVYLFPSLGVLHAFFHISIHKSPLWSPPGLQLHF